MAIAFDAASSDRTDGATSLTFSHTCTGSDRLLIVALCVQSGASSPTATYNGTSMTLVDSITSTWVHTYMFRLIAPTTGANNVALSWTGSDAAIGLATSYTGVDQTTPLGTSATASGTSTAVTVDVSSASGELVVDAVAYDQNCGGQTITVGASQTERLNILTVSACGITAGMSTESGAGATTMSWTGSDSQNWTTVGVPLKPSGATGSAASQLEPHRKYRKVRFA
jgi:hypothetical protein